MGPMVLTSRILSRIPGLVHGFTPDPAVGPAGLRRARQVHGPEIVEAAAIGSPPPRADAVLTRPGGPPAGVVTADCVPVLLAARDGSAAAAVHVGWRGLAAGVLGKALTSLRAAAPEAPFAAAVGPGAAGCCYETLEEIARRLDPKGRWSRRSRPGHALVDLRGVAAGRLEAPDIDVELVGGCTICDPRWPSYRRDGERAGRLLAFIGYDVSAGRKQDVEDAR